MSDGRAGGIAFFAVFFIVMLLCFAIPPIAWMGFIMLGVLLLIGLGILYSTATKKEQILQKKGLSTQFRVEPELRSCPYCDKQLMIPSEDYQNHIAVDHPKQKQKMDQLNNELNKEVDNLETGTLPLLHSAIMKLTLGASSKQEIYEDAFWGIFDPMYGLYRKSTRWQTMTLETARTTIEDIYFQYPCLTKLYLDVAADQLDKYGQGVKIRLLLKTLERQEEKRIDDPLKTLKLRYARGEITKEEYDEMKKTLES